MYYRHKNGVSPIVKMFTGSKGHGLVKYAYKALYSYETDIKVIHLLPKP